MGVMWENRSPTKIMDYRELARKQTAKVESKIAKFTNYTKEEFVGHWDGKKYTFQPGTSKVMQAFKAHHFATTLANKELLKIKKDPTTGRILRLPDGTPDYVVPNGDKYVSPKKPEDVPEFYDRVKKAFQMVDSGEDDQSVEGGEGMTSEMTPIEKGKDVQIAKFPEDPEDDDEFEGTPVDENSDKGQDGGLPKEPKTN